MRNLSLLLFASTLGLPVQASEEPKPPCAAQIAAQAQATVASAFQALDRKGDISEIFVELNRHFLDFHGQAPDGSVVPLPTALLSRGDTTLAALANAYVRGIQDIVLPQLLPTLHAVVLKHFSLSREQLPQFDQAVLARLEKAALDPEIFLRFIQIELNHSMGRKVTWAGLFTAPPAILQVMPGILNVNHPVHRDRAFVFGRAQQQMLAQAVYGNTSTNHGDNILEIGYGSPSVLIALRTVIPKVRLTGVDIQEIPPAALPELAKLDIGLVRGNIPSDQAAVEAVKARGPYTVIYAGDAIFPKTNRGLQFDPQVSPGEYVRFLHDELLAPQGYVVLLNDFARPPSFTRAEAEAAGFHIVRWDVSRIMPAQAIAAMRLNDVLAPRTLGDLRLFVLRKGDVDPSKVRMVRSPAADLLDRP